MASATRFFYKHAGYSYDPKTETRNQGRWRCARELARAEAEAAERGWCFTWDYDEAATLDDVNHDEWCEPDCGGVRHEILCCVVRNRAGDVLASLGGIVDPYRDYGRVIEAELASEALTGLAAAFVETAL